MRVPADSPEEKLPLESVTVLWVMPVFLFLIFSFVPTEGAPFTVRLPETVAGALEVVGDRAVDLALVLDEEQRQAAVALEGLAALIGARHLGAGIGNGRGEG